MWQPRVFVKWYPFAALSLGIYIKIDFLATAFYIDNIVFVFVAFIVMIILIAVPAIAAVVLVLPQTVSRRD
jgi:hypothetical protein